MLIKLKITIYHYYKKITSFIINCFWIVKSLLFFDKNIILISFYADYDDSNRYKNSANRLSKKLIKWGIPHLFEEVKDQGGYKKNTLFKPSFIRNKILTLKKNVIWIDCDTDPISPEAIYKISKNSKPFCAISPSGNTSEMLVGLLKFANNKFSMDLLDTWCEYCEIVNSENLNELDHEALRDGILLNLNLGAEIGYVKLKLYVHIMIKIIIIKGIKAGLFCSMLGSLSYILITIIF
jgi:hypothetical protein